MPIRNALASLAVMDIGSAMAWYERLFSRPADSRPMTEVAEWKFDDGGCLQVYERADRAGLGSMTLAVTDIGEQEAHLQQCGIDVSVQSKGPKFKTLMISDPDGNHIAFAQAMDS